MMNRTNITKMNPWTTTLAAAGVISLASAAWAEEAPSQVLTALASTTLSGYVDTAAIWQIGSGNTVIGRSFDGPGKQDGFNLNVVKLQLEKPVEEGQWSAGYSAGLLFGPDANTLGSASTLPGQAPSDFAIKDANLTLRAPVGNGLDFKLGVFATPLGYEVFESGSNPNFSRSFGFYLEPVIHTGLLVSYKVCEVLSVSGGVANRGDYNAINSRSGFESLKSYLGSITLTAPESAGFLKGATMYLAVCDGGLSSVTPGKTPTGSKDMLNYYGGLTLPTPVEGFSVGVAWDYRANGLFDSSYENAVGGYLIYQVTDKLKLASRTEYATGSLGAWGAPNVPAANVGNVKFFGETFTVDYSLFANVISRVEFRWDRSLTGQRMFNDGTDRNAFSLAFNAIYKF